MGREGYAINLVINVLRNQQRVAIAMEMMVVQFQHLIWSIAWGDSGRLVNAGRMTTALKCLNKAL
jgi:hypothetical protein